MTAKNQSKHDPGTYLAKTTPARESTANRLKKYESKYEQLNHKIPIAETLEPYSSYSQTIEVDPCRVVNTSFPGRRLVKQTHDKKQI
jgi:hypothetical protein